MKFDGPSFRLASPILLECGIDYRGLNILCSMLNYGTFVQYVNSFIEHS